MPVKRVICLQFRVREDAPDLVKDCAAVLLRNYCQYTLGALSKLNAERGYTKQLPQLITADSNIQISELEQVRDKLGTFSVYQFQYKDNRYKTFAISNTDIVDVSKIVQRIQDPEYKMLQDKLNTVVHKYSAIFPDDQEAIERLGDWHTKNFGVEPTPPNMAKYILSKPVPVYLTSGDVLDNEDLRFIYTDLFESIKMYFRTVGYGVGKQYINNQYIPDAPDSEVKIVHQNLITHPTRNVVGTLFGTQKGDRYYYGGGWMPVDLPGKKSFTEVLPMMFDQWIHEKIDNYIRYMKMEGMENIQPVYLVP